jgi:hypothetical protein
LTDRAAQLPIALDEHESVPGHKVHSTGRSNGRLEGLNSRIRLISHRSFGFHTATPLIALVYLCCTGIVIDLPR